MPRLAALTFSFPKALPNSARYSGIAFSRRDDRLDRLVFGIRVPAHLLERLDRLQAPGVSRLLTRMSQNIGADAGVYRPVWSTPLNPTFSMVGLLRFTNGIELGGWNRRLLPKPAPFTPIEMSRSSA